MRTFFRTRRAEVYGVDLAGPVDRRAAYRFLQPWQSGGLPAPSGTSTGYQRAIVCAAYLLTSVIAPTSIDSAEAFGSATVSQPGTQVVSPTSIDSAEAFGTATITVGAATVTPTSIDSAEAFGSAVVAGPITAPSIDSAEAFGTAVVAGPITLTTSIDSAEAFGTATLTQSAGVLPDSITSLEAFGTAAVYLGDMIYPREIGSGEAFGTPTVTPAATVISLVGIPSQESVGEPDVRQVIVPESILAPDAGIVDTFTRADSADVGTAWDNDGNNCQIVSSRVRAAAVGSGAAEFRNDVAWTDASVEATVAVDTVSVMYETEVSLFLRSQTASYNADGYAAFYYRDDGGVADEIWVYQVVSGVWTQIGSEVTLSPPALPYTVAFQVQGDELRVLVNGTAAYTETDTTYSGSGLVGFGTNVYGSASVADLEVSRVAVVPLGVDGQVGVPTIHQGIAPTSIASAEAFGEHAVWLASGGPILVPDSIASAEAFGTPTVIPSVQPGSTLAWELKFEQSGIILTGCCTCGPGVLLAAGYGVLDTFGSGVPNPNRLDFYRSTDDGRTWTLAYRISPKTVYTYQMIGWSNGVALLGTQDGLARSTDYGLTWTHFKPAGWTFQDALGFADIGDGYVYTWYVDELWRSSDYGLTWTKYLEIPRSRLPDNEGEYSWISDFEKTLDGAWLVSVSYAGMGRAGGSYWDTYIGPWNGTPPCVWRSEDAGATWEQIVLPCTYDWVEPDEGWGPAVVDREEYWVPPFDLPAWVEGWGLQWWFGWSSATGWVSTDPVVVPMLVPLEVDTGPIITQFARTELYGGPERLQVLANGVVIAIGNMPMQDARGIKTPPRTWRSTNHGRHGSWVEVTNQVYHTYNNDHTYQARSLRAYSGTDAVAGWEINAFSASERRQNIEDEIWTRETHDAGVRYPMTGTYDVPQVYEDLIPTEIILGREDSLIQTVARTFDTFWDESGCFFRWESQIWRAIKAAPGRPSLPTPPSPCPPSFLPGACPQECVPGDAITGTRTCQRMA